MNRDTPEDKQVERNKRIIDEVLEDSKVKYEIRDLVIREGKETQVSFRLNKEVNGHQIYLESIEATGKGFFDAIFNGCIEHISPSYSSLKNFKIESYKAKTTHKKKKNTHNIDLQSAQTDALVNVRVIVYNTISGAGGFSSRDQSLLRASINILEDIITHLVNAETAAIKLRDAIKKGHTREPANLTSQLSELVKVSNFSEAFKG